MNSKNYGGIGNADQELDDPYMGDEQTYQEHFRKTFITENQKETEVKEAWTLHDMMIPAGATVKLVRIPDHADPDFRISEVCEKFKWNQPTPVIILAGAMTQRAGKTLAGVARAAFRTDSIIIDSGLGSGIEKFCLRKNVTLVGVAPEHEIIYPRISPNEKKDNELTNGHTHFILLGDQESQMKNSRIDPKKYTWGDETAIKFDLAKRIASGRGKMGGTTPAKIVCVLVGDNPQCHKDIETALKLNIPVVVLEGSPLSSDLDPNAE